MHLFTGRYHLSSLCCCFWSCEQVGVSPVHSLWRAVASQLALVLCTHPVHSLWRAVASQLALVLCTHPVHSLWRAVASQLALVLCTHPVHSLWRAVASQLALVLCTHPVHSLWRAVASQLALVLCTHPVHSLWRAVVSQLALVLCTHPVHSLWRAVASWELEQANLATRLIRAANSNTPAATQLFTILTVQLTMQDPTLTSCLHTVPPALRPTFGGVTVCAYCSSFPTSNLQLDFFE